MKLELSIYGSVAPYTDEQLKAIRPSKLLPLSLIIMPPLELVFLHHSSCDGGPDSEAYHIHFQPIADPVAAARARERRRKMYALTKAAFSRSPGSTNPF